MYMLSGTGAPAGPAPRAGGRPDAVPGTPLLYIQLYIYIYIYNYI